jgi:hypothetical protein
MSMRLFITILFLFSVQLQFSQNNFDIVFPQANRDMVCQRCTQTFASKPREVQFSILVDDSNTIYFEITDKQWFNTLFKNEGDGLALDLVAKERYGCLEVLPDVGQIRGELLAPTYAKELRKNLRPFGENCTLN